MRKPVAAVWDEESKSVIVISPLLVEASKDRKLRGAPIHVLCYLHARSRLANTER
jgi:hypothetical protein